MIREGRKESLVGLMGWCWGTSSVAREEAENFRLWFPDWGGEFLGWRCEGRFFFVLFFFLEAREARRG